MKQPDKSDQIFLPAFPENRYASLEEVGVFLEINDVSLKDLFEVLSKVHDGYLIFSFGDTTIEFSRGFKPWAERDNSIELTVELHNEKLGKTETHDYEFRIEEFEAIRKNMELETASSEQA